MWEIPKTTATKDSLHVNNPITNDSVIEPQGTSATGQANFRFIIEL